MTNDSIIVYTSPTCGKCRMLKTRLQQKGINFIEKTDYEELSANGINELPVVILNGKFLKFEDIMRYISK